MSAPGSPTIRTPLVSNPRLALGTALALLIALFALASLIWHPAPTGLQPLDGPSPGHPLGVDQNGGDALAALMQATLTTLVVGAFTTLTALLAGVAVGVGLARWLPPAGWREAPGATSAAALVIAIVLTALGGNGTGNTILAIGLPAAVVTALATGYAVTVLSRRDFVAAARLAGLGPLAAAQRHVVPSLAPFVGILGLRILAAAAIVEPTLSYAGIGVGASGNSLGLLLREAQGFLSIQPLLAIAPGLVAVCFALALTLAASGLGRDLDPALRRAGGDDGAA